jgi:vitamin B12 transporter
MSRFSLLALSVSVALGLPHFAFARSADDEIIVTASRIDQPGYAVGGSYSIITDQELAQRQTLFIGDALRAVPGLSVNRSGPVGAFTQLRIRGAESNMTLVIVDGVKINRPDGDSVDLGSLLALDIDRIEVLRGAQSSIWGSGAVGGVVNIVTKDPENGLHGFAAFEGGSFDTTDYKARISYGSERFAVSLGGTAFYTHGISQADVAFGAAHEADADRNGSVNGRVRITPVDNLVITLDGRYINANIHTDSSPPFDSDDVQHQNERWGNASAKLTLLGGHLVNIATASVLDIKSNDLSKDAGSTFTNDGSKTILSDQLSLYANSNWLVPAAHRLSLLFEYERDAGDTAFFSPFFSAPSTGLRVTENHGYVAEYGIGIANQLFVTGSLRRDDNNRFADTYTYRGTAAFRIQRTGTRFHGSYATGIENPTFNDLFGSDAKFKGNPNLQPETSRSIDFGIEQRFFSNRLTLDATLFQNRIDNRIEGAGPTAVNIAGRTKIDGIEFTATALITADLTFDASYTAMDTADPTGAELTRRPRHSASAYLNYAFLHRRANMNVGVTYQGRSRDQDFCLPSGGGCTFPFPFPLVDLRGHTLVTLAGSLDVTPHVQFHARIENALDQRYEEVLYYGSPRLSVFGGVSVKF